MKKTSLRENNLISHSPSTKINLDSHIARIKSKTGLTLPLDSTLELLQEVSKFDAGRFLLNNKGLDGFWTAYFILHGQKQKNLSPLESWMLDNSPLTLATRERFYIFREVIQNLLRKDMSLASVPCGLMDDLLRLDFTNNKNIKLTGIDLDENSLSLAKDNAKSLGVNNVNFIKKDAWNIGLSNEFDLIASNGLNIYEPDNNKVIDLYREFYKSLKPSGILITSFITPPPTISNDSTWKNFIPEDLIKQKALFNDIIESSWQAFRTEDETKSHLSDAGFKVNNVIYDNQGMFPTITATKI